MKTKLLFFIIVFSTFTFSVKSQLKVRNAGQVAIGYPLDESILVVDTAVQCQIVGRSNGGGGGKLAFGDHTVNWWWNVCIGEYTNADTDKLWLHGRQGTYLTSGSVGNHVVACYDVTKGDYFQFYCDVKTTGLFIPSDSVFKQNISNIKDLTGLTKLKAVSYQLKNKSLKDENLKKIPENFNNKSNILVEKISPTKFGYLAQDVQKIYPNLVTKDSLGNLYVDYIGFIPLITEFLKENQDTIKLQNEKITNLESRINKLESLINASGTSSQETQDLNSSALMNNAILFQNNPNPFNAQTEISFNIPKQASTAMLYIYNLQGTQIKQFTINERGKNSIIIKSSDLKAGMYIYTLVVDSKIVDSKRMILTK